MSDQSRNGGVWTPVQTPEGFCAKRWTSLVFQSSLEPLRKKDKVRPLNKTKANMKSTSNIWQQEISKNKKRQKICFKAVGRMGSKSELESSSSTEKNSCI